jgi:hypothetical protein
MLRILSTNNLAYELIPTDSQIINEIDEYIKEL